MNNELMVRFEDLQVRKPVNDSVVINLLQQIEPTKA